MKFTFLCLFLIFAYSVNLFAIGDSDVVVQISKYDELIDKNLINKNFNMAIKIAKKRYEENLNPFNLLKLKNIYLSSGNKSGWSNYLQSAIEKYPYNAEVIFESTQLDLERKKNDQALKKADLIFISSDKKNLAYEIYISVFQSENRFADLVLTYDKYFSSDKNPELLLRRGHEYINLAQPANAQKDLQMYLSTQLPSEKTFMLQNQIYAIGENSVSTNLNLKKCLSVFPKSEACLSAFLKLNHDHKVQFAVDHFESHKDAFLKNPTVLLFIAKQYQLFNLNSKAEQNYVLLSQTNPENFENVVPLLTFYESTGLVHKSFQLTNQFLIQQPTNSAALKYQTHLSVQNRIVPAGPVTTVVASQPNEVILQKPQQTDGDGKSIFYSGNYQKLLDNKKLLNPEDPNYYFRLGQVLYLLNQQQSAIEAWKKTPKNSTAYMTSVYNAATVMALLRLKTKSLEYIKSKNIQSMQSDHLIEAIMATKYDSSRKPAQAILQKQNILDFLSLDWK